MSIYLTRNFLIYRVPMFKSKLGGLFIKKTGIPIWAEVVAKAKDKKITESLIKRIIKADTFTEY